MAAWWWLDWLAVALTLALGAMGASVIGHLLSRHRPSRAHYWVRLAGLVLMGVGEAVLVQHVVRLLTGQFSDVLDFALGRVFGQVCPLLLVHACCGYSRHNSETQPGASDAEISSHPYTRKMGNVEGEQLGVSPTEGNIGRLARTATGDAIMNEGVKSQRKDREAVSQDPRTDVDRSGPAHCGRHRPEDVLRTGKRPATGRSKTRRSPVAEFLSVYLWTVAVLLSSSTILSVVLSASGTLTCRQDVGPTVYTRSSHRQKWVLNINQDHIPHIGAHTKIIARPIFGRLKDGDGEWVPKNKMNREHFPLADTALGQQIIGSRGSREEISDVHTTKQASDGGPWALLPSESEDDTNTGIAARNIPDYLERLVLQSASPVSYLKCISSSLTELLLYFLYFVPLGMYWVLLTFYTSEQSAGGELEDCQEPVHDLNPSTDTFLTKYKTCPDLLSSEVAEKKLFTSENTSNTDFTFSAKEVSPMKGQNTTKCSQEQKQAFNDTDCSPPQLTSNLTHTGNLNPKQVTNTKDCSQLKVHVMPYRSPQSDIVAGSDSGLTTLIPRHTENDAAHGLTLVDNNPLRDGFTKADMPSFCSKNTESVQAVQETGHDQDAESVATALQTTCRLQCSFNKLGVPLNIQTYPDEQELYVLAEGENGCGMCQQLSDYLLLAACVMIIQSLVCWPLWGVVTWLSEGELYMTPSEFMFLPTFSALCFAFRATARDVRGHE